MPPRTKAVRAARRTYARLRELYPDADCALAPREPFQLLVAIVLSAQTTDVAVNRVLPGLFRAYRDVHALAGAEPEDVAVHLQTIGMFRQKAKHLVGLARGLVERHQGRVPRDAGALVALPGVGRKTANVLMGVAFGEATGIVVDTHVQRLVQRLGWSRRDEPAAIEQELSKIFPREDWILQIGRASCRERV